LISRRARYPKTRASTDPIPMIQSTPSSTDTTAEPLVSRGGGARRSGGVESVAALTISSGGPQTLEQVAHGHFVVVRALAQPLLEVVADLGDQFVSPVSR
jgi:hypothetical protein